MSGITPNWTWSSKLSCHLRHIFSCTVYQEQNISWSLIQSQTLQDPSTCNPKMALKILLTIRFRFQMDVSKLNYLLKNTSVSKGFGMNAKLMQNKNDKHSRKIVLIFAKLVIDWGSHEIWSIETRQTTTRQTSLRLRLDWTNFHIDNAWLINKYNQNQTYAQMF